MFCWLSHTSPQSETSESHVCLQFLSSFAAEDFTCTMSENLSSFNRPGIASTGTALLTGTPSSDVVKVNSGEEGLEPGWKPREGEDHHQ